MKGGFNDIESDLFGIEPMCKRRSLLKDTQTFRIETEHDE